MQNKGISLLQKLGLNADEEVNLNTEEELKIRPRQAGLSAEIDGVQGESPIFESVGAWRINGPEIPVIKNLKLVKPQTNFCTSKTLSPLQASICRFHEQHEQHESNKQLTSLKQKAEALEQKIESMKNERRNINETTKTRKELARLLQRFHEIPSDYADAFKLVKLLAKNPSLVASTRLQVAKYQQEKKNPFEISNLSITVANSYSSNLISEDIFFQGHFDEWGILREFLFDVQNLRSMKNKNNVPDKLWCKFLRKSLFPKMSQRLSYDTSDACADWANSWFEKGLFTESNLILFFINVAKPFLVHNLQILCKNMKIHKWIMLAQTKTLASQFGIIVRTHADEVLKKWNPPSPFAHELLEQWPNVLGNSLDFMYHTVAPKLVSALSDGNIDPIIAWIDILPIPLSASIVADAYMKHYVNEISIIIKKDKVKAAELYIKMKSEIPTKIISHPKIINRFIDALDILKDPNPILKGIKIERDPEPSSVGDLLEDIAAKMNMVFMSKGTIDGRTSYSIGPHIFGVLDGVLFFQQEKNWIPIFVKDIEAIVKQ
ncbi:hypothetical protein TRFO_24248 [Tritrichomonas foetus]|uniref:GCF C-terminal domain-containing protein n=1 Tax=Tritrichomonas foetus TaxID=1144522 RepID=A0A1J4K989_9EUKA|nr:hypothetical protein TRFO_24248 [Tritrichomonas foetus]|eukprot:OHT07506.1 hypothetical protein TRFO_24248 [Tritrichomonas foetus]